MAPEVVPRDGDGERESHNDGSQKCDRCQAAVKGDLTSQGQTFSSQPTQKADSAGPGSHSQRAAREREQGGFDYRLADHMPAARSQRLTDREFFHAAAGADEKQ